MARRKNEPASDGITAMIRVTAPRKGFRRAGKLWQGVTTCLADELTAEQIVALKAEPKLTVEEV